MKTIMGNEATEEYVGKMKAVFDGACNKVNWKHPFEVRVSSIRACEKLAEAVDWFQAATVEIIPDGKMFIVRSPGYQAW